MGPLALRRSSGAVDSESPIAGLFWVVGLTQLLFRPSAAARLRASAMVFMGVRIRRLK
jgi:hypothetical protein